MHVMMYYIESAITSTCTHAFSLRLSGFGYRMQPQQLVQQTGDTQVTWTLLTFAKLTRGYCSPVCPAASPATYANALCA